MRCAGFEIGFPTPRVWFSSCEVWRIWEKLVVTVSFVPKDRKIWIESIVATCEAADCFAVQIVTASIDAA